MNERSFRVYISCTKLNNDYYACDYYDISLSDNERLCFGTEDFSAERLRSSVKKYAVRVYNGKVSNGVVARHYTDLTPYYVMASINAPVSSLRLWVSAFYPNFARFERCDWVVPCGWVFYHGWFSPVPTSDTSDTTSDTSDTSDTTSNTSDTTSDTTTFVFHARKHSVVKPVRIFPRHCYPVICCPYGAPADYYPYKILVDGLKIWDCRSHVYNEYLADLIGSPPYDQLPF